MSRLDKFAPPGADVKPMKYYMIFVGVIWFFMDMIVFFVFLAESTQQLYEPFTRELMENAQMIEYGAAWDQQSMRLSWIYALSVFGFLIGHYQYFHWTSQSIYTMARVRSPWELHIRCWTLPLLWTVALVAGRMILRVILFGIYVLATPAGVPKPGFEQLIGGLL